MVNFKLSNELSLQQELYRKFAETELKPIAAEADETETFPMDVWKKVAKYGMLGIPFPAEYEGSGSNNLSYSICVEELSKQDASIGVSVSVHTSLCSTPIFMFGNEDQKKKYLCDLASGRKYGAFGLTEPTAGSDVAGAITTAKKDGDKYILNGLKCFITNGPIATDLIVYALTAPELGPNKGMSAFHVTPGIDGFSIGNVHNKMGLKAALVGELVFENCAVDASQLLGTEGKGFGTAMNTLNGGRIGVGAQGLGIAEGAYEVARKYLMERQQFGKPLCKQQYIQFKMAELKIKIEAAKFMVYRAAMDKQEHRDYSISAAMAKYIGTNTAMEVTTEAVQMLGGNGYMKEYHVERMMRDAKITQIYEGTNEIQKLIISGTLFR